MTTLDFDSMNRDINNLPTEFSNWKELPDKLQKQLMTADMYRVWGEGSVTVYGGQGHSEITTVKGRKGKLEIIAIEGLGGKTLFG